MGGWNGAVSPLLPLRNVMQGSEGTEFELTPQVHGCTTTRRLRLTTSTSEAEIESSSTMYGRTIPSNGAERLLLLLSSSTLMLWLLRRRHGHARQHALPTRPSRSRSCSSELAKQRCIDRRGRKSFRTCRVGESKLPRRRPSSNASHRDGRGRLGKVARARAAHAGEEGSVEVAEG